MHQYIIVCFLSDNTPSRFLKKNWPLHVTIHRSFFSESTSEELEQALEPVCRSTPTLVQQATNEALFGPRENVPVTELELTHRLEMFHRQVHYSCRPHVKELRGPTYPVFRPHVSAQREEAVHPGDSVTLRSLTLIKHGQSRHKVFTLPFLGD